MLYRKIRTVTRRPAKDLLKGNIGLEKWCLGPIWERRRYGSVVIFCTDFEDEELAGFDDGLDIENEGEKGIRVDFDVWDQSSLKDEITID